MASLQIWPQALRFLTTVERKHAGQIALKVLALLADSKPPDAKKLAGSRQELWRVDSGEYRIVYQVVEETVVIVVVGKRNDDDVYKSVRRQNL